MKNIFIVVAFLFFEFSAQAQMCPIQLTLKGKIINKVDLGADCGYLKLASVIEFEIIEFADLNYKQKNVGIVFRCPEFYGDNFFEVGNTYEIKVLKEYDGGRDFDYTIQNPEVLKKYNLPNNYWALNGNAEKLKM